MQKKLIAIAVAGLMAAPVAMAETTVYGIASAAVASVDDGVDGATSVTGTHVISNSSRLGVKGSEDLGGGMSAVYQFEFGVDMAEDQTLISGAKAESGVTNRNQFVGLAGGFGTVLIGRHDTPYKVSVAKLDIFADTIADYNNIVGNNGAFDTREGNVIAYAAPKLGDISILAAYIPDETDNDLDDGGLSASVNWSSGPLFLGLGYLNASAADIELDGIRVGAGYTMGTLSLGAVYETTTLDPVGPGNDVDSTNLYINAAFDMGAGNTIKAAYGTMDPDESDNNATLMAIGFDHAFSKSTSAYAQYVSLDLEDAATASLGAGGSGLNAAVAAGETGTALAFGIVHKF